MGATIIAILLGFLAFAGFQNAFLWRSLGDLGGVPLLGGERAFVAAAQQPLFTALSLTYGATALVAAMAVWFMRSWMGSAFLVWGLVFLAEGAWMWEYFPIEAFPIVGGRYYLAVMEVGTVALVWFCWKFLRRIAGESPVSGAM